MKIDGTEFGSITIDGETYPHDVLIRLSGEIKKRRNKAENTSSVIKRVFE